MTCPPAQRPPRDPNPEEAARSRNQRLGGTGGRPGGSRGWAPLPGAPPRQSPSPLAALLGDTEGVLSPHAGREGTRGGGDTAGMSPEAFPRFFGGGVKLTWTRTQVRVARTDTRSCRLGSVHFTYYTCIYKYIHTRPLGHEEEEGAELRGSRPAGRGLTLELPEQRWGKDETNPRAVPGPPSPFPRGCDPQLGATLADLVTKATPGSPSMSRVRELNPARAGPSRARPGRTRREPLSSPALLLGTQSHACVAVPLAGGHCPIPLSHAWGLKQ